MKFSGILLLALASIISLSFALKENTVESHNTVEIKQSFKNAIIKSNMIAGTDSLYLSEFSKDFQPDKLLISDHLVLVNDLQVQSDLLSKNFQFSIGAVGHLELVDFNLKLLESEIVNFGSVTLKNCLFEEGKNLTRLISNHGAFSISNGKFEGSSEGDIYRDAVFSHAARIIL